jgi:signal transduction histidine kinase
MMTSTLHSIRWKLIVLTTLVVAAPIYFLNQEAIKAFNAFTSRAQEAEMISHARIIGEQYRAFVHAAAPASRTGAEERFAALLRELGPELQSRLRVLTPEGRVCFDSSARPMIDAELSAYPEVARAMAVGYGSRWAIDHDENRVYYYIALAIRGDEGAVALVHVLRHTSPIIKAIVAIQHDQRVAMTLALLAAVAAATILAQTMTRRLRKLTRDACAFASGEHVEHVVRGRDEIGELGAAMARMARDLARRNAYNRDFVATVMHELKAPLTAIKGAVEVLGQGAGEKPEPRAKFLGNIAFEVERLIRMVGELTALTKLDTDDVDRAAAPIDYAAWVRGFAQRAETMFPARPGIRFSVPAGELWVAADPDRLEQVLCNLLDNAVRYTPADGAIDVDVSADRAQVVIQVRDTGRGIAASNLDKVFDRFFTTEPKGRTDDYGSGLGLAVARAIVERYHGTISVASAEQSGATFTVALPRVR